MSTIITQSAAEPPGQDAISGQADMKLEVDIIPVSDVDRMKQETTDPIAYITVTDHRGTVLKRVSITNRDVQDEIDMVGSPFRDRGGLDPFHMVIRSFEDALAKAMETAWSQAT